MRKVKDEKGEKSKTAFFIHSDYSLDQLENDTMPPRTVKGKPKAKSNPSKDKRNQDRTVLNQLEQSVDQFVRSLSLSLSRFPPRAH